MTNALYPSLRADRISPRPVGREPAGVSVGADHVADYVARRVVAALLAVLVVAVVAIAASALIGALADVGGRPAAASVATAGSDAPIVRIHVAQPGDTLWSIADRYRGEVGQSRFVDALIDVNGGTVIQVGQAVRLP